MSESNSEEYRPVRCCYLYDYNYENNDCPMRCSKEESDLSGSYVCYTHKFWICGWHDKEYLYCPFCGSKDTDNPIK